MGFTKTQLATFRNASVPDLLGASVSLLFVGINPGLWTAATQTHFCHPSNRFYPALREAGIIEWTVNPDQGMTDTQREDLTHRGIGITNLVNRATVRASQLESGELRAGADRLRELISAVSPLVVAVAGVTAYRLAFDARRAGLGPQPTQLGTGQLWVVPNPSGLNAHETTTSLADWYREVAAAAGIT